MKDFPVTRLNYYLFTNALEILDAARGSPSALRYTVNI